MKPEELLDRYAAAARAKDADAFLDLYADDIFCDSPRQFLRRFFGNKLALALLILFTLELGNSRHCLLDDERPGDAADGPEQRFFDVSVHKNTSTPIEVQLGCQADVYRVLTR